MMEQKQYVCIDLKSFYASVECVDRGLDPMTTNLVVADPNRTEKTICLAVTPSLKAYGISGRARLFEVIQRLKAVNYERQQKAPGRRLTGASSCDPELKANPALAVDYIVAPPRMAHYIEVSTQIYQVYLKYNECDDSKLYIAMNLSFACSLRIGEILGLTWDNVHITDEDISSDNAWVYVDKELERVSMRALKALGEKSIIKVFTPLMPNTSTRVVLKTPKTESSVRKVWLPKTLAYILREWQTAQTELKEYLGDEYQDDNLVIALPNGRPCENRIIAKEFEKLKEKANLPNVVFHSLRHSSTTYKLKLNHGDLKATQGDTGHAQLDMITDIYAHILDEDRKVNAQKFEAAFYGTRDLRDVKPPEEPKQQTVDLTALIEQLQKNPELASTLAALIANGSNASC